MLSGGNGRHTPNVVEKAVLAAVREQLRRTRDNHPLTSEARRWLAEVEGIDFELAPMPIAERKRVAARMRAALDLIEARELDPALALSFVVWPSARMLASETAPAPHPRRSGYRGVDESLSVAA